MKKKILIGVPVSVSIKEVAEAYIKWIDTQKKAEGLIDAICKKHEIAEKQDPPSILSKEVDVEFEMLENGKIKLTIEI